MVRFKRMAAVFVLAALAAGPAVAQGPQAGGPGRDGRGAGPLAGVPLASLNLTQTQQDRIRDIREKNRQEMQALQDRMRNDILSVLTAEQQTQLKQLQAEQGDRRERRRSRQP